MYRWLFLLPFILTACEPRVIYYGWEHYIDDYAASNVVLTYAAELQHEKGLKLEDSQVYYSDRINRIDLVFSTQSILELREARELLVDVVEGFLQKLNDDPVMPTQLADFFSADNLEIHINLESYWPLYGDPFYIGWIVLEEGMAYYYAADIKDFYADYWHTRVEPYRKSLQFVDIERRAEADYLKKHPPKESPEVLIERALMVGGKS